jgi:hypothetical protein
MEKSKQNSVKLLKAEFHANPFGGFKLLEAYRRKDGRVRSIEFHKMQVISTLAKELFSKERFYSIILGRWLLGQAYTKFLFHCSFRTVPLIYKHSGQILLFHIPHENEKYPVFTF